MTPRLREKFRTGARHMNDKISSLRRILIQHLETDRQLGLRSVPIRPRVPVRRIGHAHAPRIQNLPKAEIDARTASLNALDVNHVKDCRKCALCETRKQTVFGSGSPAARVMFVGEAPGAEEDRQGLPFVGRAGQLLTQMIGAMKLKREDVYICNVLKCRPPDNRTPAADEVAACSPYLLEQLRVVHPEVIVALGAPAAQSLLGTGESIGRLRGRFHEYRLHGSTPGIQPIPLMPTYHPAYLLRSPGEKSKTWADLQMVMAHLGIPLPG